MADNCAAVKDMLEKWMGDTKDVSLLIDMLADNATMTQGDGSVTEGKDAIKAMVEGMVAKMGDVKIAGSNYTAADENTVTYDLDRNGDVSKRKMVFEGGKIVAMGPA